MEEKTMMVKKGGYKSQMLDEPPRNYIGTSQITDDLPGDVNSYGRSSGGFDISVSEKTSWHGVATRRDPIPFETGGKRKEPKIIG